MSPTRGDVDPLGEARAGGQRVAEAGVGVEAEGELVDRAVVAGVAPEDTVPRPWSCRCRWRGLSGRPRSRRRPSTARSTRARPTPMSALAEAVTVIFGLRPAAGGDRRRPDAHLGVVGGLEVQQLGERVAGRVGDALGGARRSLLHTPASTTSRSPAATAEPGVTARLVTLAGVSGDLLDERRRRARAGSRRSRAPMPGSVPTAVGGRHRERVGVPLVRPLIVALGRRVGSVDGGRRLRGRPDVRGHRVAR